MANDYMENEPDDQQDAVRGAPDAPDSSDAADEPTDDAGEPVVIPKSACPGMDLKPGLRMSFVVDKVYGDEFTAHYVSSAGQGEAEPAPEGADAFME